MIEVKGRRYFLSLAGLFAAGAATGISLPINVDAMEEWQELPTFQNGDLLSAQTLTAMRDAIFQLQNEVERLRKK